MAADVLAKTEAPVLPNPTLSPRAAGFNALLLLSGFCGISYEVLYGRILGNFIGDQFAISSSILLTFMLGIGFGALHAHRLWSRLWIIEAVIGGYAAAAALGSNRVASFFYASSLLSHGIAGSMLVCFLLLALPSFLIGCSLPLFAGYLARLAPSGVFARAYMLYNLGAAGTVLVVEFVLLRALGIQRTVLIMAGLNLFVSAALCWRFRGIATLAEQPTVSTKPEISKSRHLVALALASTASAVFQLLFVKVSECFLGPFRQTFALVLTVVFLGLAAGSAISRRWKPNFSSLLVWALVGIAWIVLGFEWIMRAYAWAHPVTAEYVLAGLANKLTALVLLMGVPATAFGALIPALLSELGNVARQSGRLLFVSSLANAAGFLLMAFVLHRYVDYGLIFFAIAGLLLMAIATHSGFRNRAFLLGCVTVLLLVGAHFVRWDENLLYTGYDAFRDPEDLAAARRRLKFPERFKGFQDVFSLNQVGNDVHFFINGYISIALNSPAEKIVGAFPSLFAPRTDRALVLGVGSGATSGTVATLFDQVDAVEINPVLLPNLHRMEEHNFAIAKRTNVNFVLDDAMHFTRICQRQYPLIINTVTAPIYFSSSKLYTVDFLTSIRRILEADGIYVTWVDGRIGDTGLDMIFKTVSAAGFKHCALGGIKSGYFLLLCSDAPIRLQQPTLVTSNAFLSEYFRRNGVLPELLPYGLLSTSALDLIMDPTRPANTLDRPVLEFAMARLDDFYTEKWATKLFELMNLEEPMAALEPAIKVNLVDLALHTEALYKDSPLAARRHRLIDDRMDDFYEKYQPARLKYCKDWAALAQTPRARQQYVAELIRQKQYSTAIEEEQQILKLNPGFGDGYYTIGHCHELARHYPEALQSYEQHRKLFPDDDRIALALGRVYFKLAKYEEALAALRQAQKAKPKFENFLYLSQTLEALGRNKEAEEQYQKGLKLGNKASQIENANSAAQ